MRTEAVGLPRSTAIRREAGRGEHLAREGRGENWGLLGARGILVGGRGGGGGWGWGTGGGGLGARGGRLAGGKWGEGWQTT